MYMLRFFNKFTAKYDLEGYPCWFEALRRAKDLKRIMQQPVEIYERREVI